MILQLHITGIAYGGDGIGRHEGRVVFIPGALPGEKVSVELVGQHASFDRARLLAVDEPSPDRCETACPLAVRPWKRPIATSPFCAGCAYQHLAYPAEVATKQAQLIDFLGQADIAAKVCGKPVAAPAPLGYRNKLVLHTAIDRTERMLGYVQADNHTVLDIPACPLVNPAINTELAARRADSGFWHTLRHGMDVTFRYTEHDGVIWWRGAPDSGIQWLTENMPGGSLRVPAGSFFQVNTAVAALMVKYVTKQVRASRASACLDLYCGVGLFGLAVAEKCAIPVTGVESNEAAVKAAEYTARQPAYAGSSIRYIAGDAAKAMWQLGPAIDPAGTIAIIDPPRGGLDPAMRAALVAAKPRTILYVSCAPDKLPRDLRDFAEAGYKVKKAQLFDMFPRTAHFEVIVQLVR